MLFAGNAASTPSTTAQLCMFYMGPIGFEVSYVYKSIDNRECIGSDSLLIWFGILSIYLQPP